MHINYFFIFLVSIKVEFNVSPHGCGSLVVPLLRSHLLQIRGHDINPTRVYLCPMSCGGCGAPRVIVVAGMDP